MTKKMRVQMIKPHVLGQVVEVPIKVVDGNLCVILCAKDKDTRASATYKLVKRTAQLEAKGYKPVFSAFAEYLKNQGVHIDVFLRESKKL